MQRSFSDLEYGVVKRVTRRERFLSEIDAVMPWGELLAVLEPYYPRSGCRPDMFCASQRGDSYWRTVMLYRTKAWSVAGVAAICTGCALIGKPSFDCIQSFFERDLGPLILAHSTVC